MDKKKEFDTSLVQKCASLFIGAIVHLLFFSSYRHHDGLLAGTLYFVFSYLLGSGFVTFIVIDKLMLFGDKDYRQNASNTRKIVDLVSFVIVLPVVFFSLFFYLQNVVYHRHNIENFMASGFVALLGACIVSFIIKQLIILFNRNDTDIP